MRDGRGWQPHLETATQELSQLSTALVELGPGLERQVREWIEAERRSAVALILVRLRVSLDEAQRRAVDRLRAIEQLAGDSREDRDLLIAALAAELGDLPRLPEREARHVFETDLSRLRGARGTATQPRG